MEHAVKVNPLSSAVHAFLGGNLYDARRYPEALIALQHAIELLRPRLAADGRVILAASVYAEILVHPTKRGTDHTIDEFLRAIGADIIAVDRHVARRAAQLRASHNALRLVYVWSADANY
jgi:hypothetical protein